MIGVLQEAVADIYKQLQADYEANKSQDAA